MLARRCATRTSFALATLFVACAPVGAASAQAAGRLHVTSTPLGEVIVDGHPTGARTPAPRIALPAGEHEVTVRFSRTGRTAPAQRVTVRAGGTAFAFFRDRPADADLERACTGGEDAACWMLAFREVERGDGAAAEPRLEDYLRHFPDGAYAETARSMLVTLRAERLEAQGARRGWLVAVALVVAATLAFFGLRRLPGRPGERGR